MTGAGVPLFDPAAFVEEIEAAARDGGWTIDYLSPAEAYRRPWLQRAAKSGADAPSFYASAGIHGDEIAGPAAMLEMLRRPGFFDDFNVTLFPILNPLGLAANVRHNPQGIDLNRDYREPKSSEIAGHLAVLKTLGRYDAAVYLHEDFEGIGAYLFELNEGLPPGLGAEMIAAMERHVPIDRRPSIDEMTAHEGVINRRDVILAHGAIENRPDWPEAIYLSLYHTTTNYTLESPMPFPLPLRVAAQIAAVETVLEALRKKRANASATALRPHPAIIPVPKLEEDCYDWWARHLEILELKKTFEPQIVLIGDSITHFWGGNPVGPHLNGITAWEKVFHDLPVLNLGFGWDRTQNVLWRLDHGEFDDLHPKTVVIEIGTNNLSETPRFKASTPTEIVEGILQICARVRKISPASRIIIMGLLPRGESPTDIFRGKVDAVNQELKSALASRPDLELLEIGARFLEPDGTMPVALMPDGVHPSDAGYHIWADALLAAGIRG